MSVHLRAIMDPDVPVCRGVMEDGDRLGSEAEGDCPTCLHVRAGGWITKRVERWS